MKLIAFIALLTTLVNPSAALQHPQWRDTGLDRFQGDGGNGFQFDPDRPHTLLYTPQAGQVPGQPVAYDWLSHQPVPVRTTPGAHPITHAAADGTRRVYSFDSSYPGSRPAPLWTSPDGGTTWRYISTPVGDRVVSLAVSAADARAIYVATRDHDSVPGGEVTYSIYYSPDAGTTWDHRHTETIPGNGTAEAPSLSVTTLPGLSTPVNLVIIETYRGAPDSVIELALSGDGARTVHPAGSINYGPVVLTSFVYTARGLLRQTIQSFEPPPSTPDNISTPVPSTTTVRLDRTTNGGQTWQSVALPPPAQPYGPFLIQSAPSAPATVVFNNGNALWLSTDSAASWQPLPGRPHLYDVSAYLPVTVLAGEEVVSTAELPETGKTLLAPLPATGAPGSRYFTETDHTVPEIFLRYWESHGGLPQFGFPRTDPVREIGTDDHIYTVQYFERARFEYHPEYAGTVDEIELGLLGSELTAPRRAAGESRFAPIADPHNGSSYFAATGHTLAAPFAAYWRDHGGLARYGYPISEAAPEVSTDGQVYVVQYYERARLEYHPEHTGTPAEVQLGLLGNTLLTTKGWQ